MCDDSSYEINLDQAPSLVTWSTDPPDLEPPSAPRPRFVEGYIAEFLDELEG
jgi:hypothetical protein